jgi:Transposase
MRIIGCDLHARQQTIAMLDTDTGELVEKVLGHEGEEVREFYAALPKPVLVGIEATGTMQWFLKLMEELGIECRVGHPAEIRKAETRKQKHDRRDAYLLLKLLAEKRFSNYLDAFDRAPRSTGVAATPSSVGTDADASTEHAAIHGAQ